MGPNFCHFTRLLKLWSCGLLHLAIAHSFFKFSMEWFPSFANRRVHRVGGGRQISFTTRVSLIGSRTFFKLNYPRRVGAPFLRYLPTVPVYQRFSYLSCSGLLSLRGAPEAGVAPQEPPQHEVYLLRGPEGGHRRGDEEDRLLHRGHPHGPAAQQCEGLKMQIWLVIFDLI